MTDPDTHDALGEVPLSPNQAMQLLAIAAMLRDGDLEIRGDDEQDAGRAAEAIIDIGQEIALHVKQ